MKSVYNFVVKPIGKRYNNTTKIEGKDLILNTEIYSHKFVNRFAEVLSVPMVNNTNISIGDTVIVHHNVFRKWHNQYGIEKNSRSYFDENTYIINDDQIFLYKNNNEWRPLKGYCFVQPVKNTNLINVDKEKPLIGIVKHTDGTVKKNDLVGFRPESKYEFIIDGKRLYRLLSNFITIKYEYQGNEEEYNPSWAQGG